jgi:hypothetical protein
MNERELLEQYINCRKESESKEAACAEAKKKLDKAEFELIEYMENNSLAATAKYDHLGYAILMKPKVYANCDNDDLEKLYDFLKSEGREDLIKTTVSKPTLTTYVRARLEEGKELPEYIKYYFKQSLKLYGG